MPSPIKLNKFEVFRQKSNGTWTPASIEVAVAFRKRRGTCRGLNFGEEIDSERS